MIDAANIQLRGGVTYVLFSLRSRYPGWFSVLPSVRRFLRGASGPVAQPEVNVNDPQNIAKRTRDLKRLCAVLWIVIGILLCLTCVGIVAGIWNIIYGAKALKFADTIQAGNRSVYAAFDADLNSLTVGLILNLILGLGLGCALAIVELFLRDRVLKNKEVFGA